MLVIQSSAEDDLINIWLYSLGQWDESTADKYLDLQDQAIQKLLTHPELGMEWIVVRLEKDIDD